MPEPYVIAEAGSTHEETLSNALRLIEVAAEAGADACKFQYWSNPQRMRERRHMDASGAYDLGSIRSQWWTNLRDKCHAVNIAFACSVYLPEDVQEMAQYVDVFKVSSFEALDRELTDRVIALRGDRPFFLSTGMQEASDDRSLPKEAIYLHCVSAYPCPMEEASLGAIEPHEGYSDHTRCVYTGGLAVASGADYLEVHYRLDSTSAACPDYPVALTPNQLAQYVFFARTAWEARGTGEKVIQPSERENMRFRVLA